MQIQSELIKQSLKTRRWRGNRWNLFMKKKTKQEHQLHPHTLDDRGRRSVAWRALPPWTLEYRKSIYKRKRGTFKRASGARLFSLLNKSISAKAPTSICNRNVINYMHMHHLQPTWQRQKAKRTSVINGFVHFYGCTACTMLVMPKKRKLIKSSRNYLVQFVSKNTFINNHNQYGGILYNFVHNANA